ncbi:hypothetical protein MAPG_10839 [Magnaporthiopsis poae ATCC 64411]|uniref:C2H2-type domain-containing protein n=1 Tax=Magnaporthiopsis poae (strain ATCC 64411 / 73-15) TaxID=644358 RepID=A0A0C4EDN3_MAGP6|nr:hypothetical protein MAPG_10839 [Magnaporthiopsis poae ATCC 64411]
MSSTQSAKFVIGGLELPDPDRLTGLGYFFTKQIAKELKPKLDVFNARATQAPANAQQMLEGAWVKFRDADQVLTEGPADDITKAGGNVDGLVLHLHYPPLSTRDPPNALVHEQKAATIRMLKRSGFDGDNAFWLDTCPRRQPYTVPRGDSSVPFSAADLPADYLGHCLEHVDDVYRSVSGRFVVLFGKANQQIFETKWQSQNRLHKLPLYGQRFKDITVWVLYTDRSKDTIQSIVIPCSHPSYMHHAGGSINKGAQYDLALQCAALMAGIARTDEQQVAGERTARDEARTEQAAESLAEKAFQAAVKAAKKEARAKAEAEKEAVKAAKKEARAKAEAENEAVRAAKKEARAEARANNQFHCQVPGCLLGPYSNQQVLERHMQKHHPEELKSLREAEAAVLARAKAETEAVIKAEAEAVVKAKAKAKAAAEAEAEAKAEAVAKAKAKARAEAKAKTKAKNRARLSCPVLGCRHGPYSSKGNLDRHMRKHHPTWHMPAEADAGCDSDSTTIEDWATDPYLLAVAERSRVGPGGRPSKRRRLE